jgi:hypothetical protein
MNGNFANFRAVYDALTDEVGRARYQFLPDHLRNWFEVLDTTPSVATIVRRLQAGLDVENWIKESMTSMTGMVGSGKLSWPANREQSLGMKLLLFRQFAKGKQEIAGFGHYFMYVGNNINDNAQAFVEQVFMPMARELRRLLEQELASTAAAPASDRIVTLDHNSPAYKETKEALENLEKVISEANDFDDVEEKEQHVAEISAVRRLFDAVRVRIEPVVALLKPLAIQFASKLKDTLLGKAVAWVVSTVISLLGQIL